MTSYRTISRPFFFDSRLLTIPHVLNLWPDWHVLTRGAIIIMGHLQTSPPKATFHIEALIRLAAIQNALVTTHFLRDEIQGLDYLEP